ncbi:MAG: c-type cytochrome biogenesis protein CcsB [Candidatus Omnitrophica bacterium]|jgi:cytochrome c-type biogenesis protein CcsB|nr:c-type cytochrome biogenesis protein CcsB [Candidatus Omnitrophota bacterium]MDD5079622.1 c-type cytochrome biogenesis protein CcsB [Candidatus Omnitrophota bacterium]
MQVIFLRIALGSYLLSFLSGWLNSYFRNDLFPMLAVWLLKAGFLLHTLILAMRWYEAKRPPFANMYEALVLFAWSIILIYMLFDLIYKIRFISRPVTALVLIVMGFAAVLDNSIGPLMPALQSRWIIIHVVSYFLGYAAMSLSVICGIYFLNSSKGVNPNEEKLRTLDSLGYYSIAFAFPFLTIGMTTGSIWANVAWGTYWNWDPKETCSLITWMVYALYLHLRMFKGLKAEKAAWLSVIGYFAVLFTFVGVNFILPGLHSYS